VIKEKRRKFKKRGSGGSKRPGGQIFDKAGAARERKGKTGNEGGPSEFVGPLTGFAGRQI